MQVITKITQQKNNVERYNIYLNDKYAFPVDEAILVKYALTKGSALTPDEIAEINYEDEIRKAYNKALHYLSFQMRSEHEIQEKLRTLSFGDAVILEAIQKLKAYGFINDETFATALLNTKKQTMKKGPKAIAQDMHKKGITKQTQEEVLQQYTTDEQLELAEQLAEKVARSEKQKTPAQIKQKIQATLSRKGYTFDVINEVLQRITLERDDQDWREMIQLQGEKIWHKQSKKYEGYALNMRVKQALYQKGFPSDIIETFISEKENDNE